MALGLLEESWEQGLDDEEATELAVKSIRSAVQRDSGSGSGVLVAVIDDDGYRVVQDSDTHPVIEE